MKRKKRNYTKTIDLLFLLVLLIVMIYAFWSLFQMNLLPMHWLLAAIAVAAIIYLRLLAAVSKRRPRWVSYIRRCFIIVLCAFLLSIGHYSGRINRLFNAISVAKDETVTVMILARNDGTISSLSDLNSSSVIGIQNGTDSDTGTFAKEKLSSDAPNAAFSEDTYYATLINNLTYGNLDAVAISAKYYDMMIKTDEIEEDSFCTLATYTYTKTWEDDSNKDLSTEGFTVYISGIDELGTPDQQLRSDVNILLFINPLTHHVTMVSIPRDAYLPNKAYEDSEFALDKLTHTGLYGIDTTVETVEDFFDINIDYYARISFSSVIEIVDALGGIDVDVEIDFCEQDEYRNKDEAHQICLSSGEQHLDGQQALAYARHRKTAGYDTAGRERAQQRILKAIIDKTLSLDGISSLDQLMDIIPSYVETNMPASKMADFAKEQLRSLKPWTIESLSLDNGVNAHYMFQASLNDLADAYIFSRTDVQYVEYAYESNCTNPQMNDFSFDLNDLSAGKKQFEDKDEYVWSDEVQAY